MKHLLKIVELIVGIIFILCLLLLPLFLDKCGSPHPKDNMSEEEIENIVDDPSWNIPSRYRD